MTPIIFKTAGGAASQLLGLTCALDISRRTKREFVIQHFPFATGAYYPFALKGMLFEDEILDLNAPTKSFTPPKELQVGGILRDHPVQRSGFSREKIASFLREYNLDGLIAQMRFEWRLLANQKRMKNVPRHIKSVTGGFPPVNLEYSLINMLQLRFDRANIKINIEKPRLKKFDNEPRIFVIHFRIGDKRLMYSYPTVKGDGIMNPLVFKRILELEKFSKLDQLYVVSDEPKFARDLLASVKIEAKIANVDSNLWEDIQLMIESDVLICPWSSVSQFVSSIRAYHKNTTYYPDADGSGEQPAWKLDGLRTYPSFYLSEHSDVYLENYQPINDKYNIYKSESLFEQ